MSKLSERLEQISIDKNISVREIERITGISDTGILKYFKDKNKSVNPKILKKLSTALEVNYNELLFLASISAFVNGENTSLQAFYKQLKGKDKQRHLEYLESTVKMSEEVIDGLNQSLTDNSDENQVQEINDTINELKYNIDNAKKFIEILNN